MALGLIDNFRIRATGHARLVVAFVDQNGSALLESVAIRGISPERHQDYRVVPTNTKIHSLLKSSPLPATHFDIRNDVVGLRFNSSVFLTRAPSAGRLTTQPVGGGTFSVSLKTCKCNRSAASAINPWISCAVNWWPKCCAASRLVSASSRYRRAGSSSCLSSRQR